MTPAPVPVPGADPSGARSRVPQPRLDLDDTAELPVVRDDAEDVVPSAPGSVEASPAPGDPAAPAPSEQAGDDVGAGPVPDVTKGAPAQDEPAQDETPQDEPRQDEPPRDVFTDAPPWAPVGPAASALSEAQPQWAPVRGATPGAARAPAWAPVADAGSPHPDASEATEESQSSPREAAAPAEVPTVPDETPTSDLAGAPAGSVMPADAAPAPDRASSRVPGDHEPHADAATEVDGRDAAAPVGPGPTPSAHPTSPRAVTRVYADGSALSRYLVGAPARDAWLAWTSEHEPELVTTPLGLTELRRIAQPRGVEAHGTAHDVSERIETARFSDQTLRKASSVTSVLSPFLALHLGAALADPDVTAVATYDVKLARVASLYGLRVVTPGWPDKWWEHDSTPWE